MSKLSGYLLVATGFLACPCHLVLTLPLALALLGGTAIGGFLTQNSGLIVGVFSAYFLGALALGLLLINHKSRTRPQGRSVSLSATGPREKPATLCEQAAFYLKVGQGPSDS